MSSCEIIMFIKHHMVLVVLWCLLLGIMLYTTIIYWIRRDYEISCDDAICLINKKNAMVIDIRTQDEYHSGYIINSVNTPLVDIKKNNVFLCRKSKNNPVIIVYNHDALSLYSIRKYLNKLGFMEVYVLQGGIHSWKNQDFPLLSKKG